MTALANAIKYVRARIDRRLLIDGFLDDEERELQGLNQLDKAILEKLIRPVVVVDLSTKGGVSYDIDLAGVDYEEVDRWTRNYHIPPEKTEGRNIVQAQYAGRSLHGGSTAVVPNYYNHYGRKTGLLHQAAKMNASHVPFYQSMTADVDIIAPNVVQIRDFNMVRTTLVLKVKLELSPNLDEIRPPYWSEFNKLVFAAVRRYVYTQLRLELDLGKLESGREFSAYNEALEEMSDAADIYDEELEKWTKYLILNDKRSQQSVYRMAGKYTN